MQGLRVLFSYYIGSTEVRGLKLEVPARIDASREADVVGPPRGQPLAWRLRLREVHFTSDGKGLDGGSREARRGFS